MEHIAGHLWHRYS